MVGKVAPYFAVGEHVHDFIGAGTGGKETYSGRDMAGAHKGMNVTERELIAAIDDVLMVLRKHGIGEQAQFTSPDLHSHVAIAKVISGLEQDQGIGAAHLHKLLRCRPHLDQRFGSGGGQPLTGFQG